MTIGTALCAGMVATGCRWDWATVESRLQDGSIGRDVVPLDERPVGSDVAMVDHTLVDSGVHDAGTSWLDAALDAMDTGANPDDVPVQSLDVISTGKEDEVDAAGGTDVVTTMDEPVDVPTPPNDTGWSTADTGSPDDTGSPIVDTGVPDDTGSIDDLIVQDPCEAQGLTNCGGGCVDTANDSFNCGGCDNICNAGTQCSSGRCLPF